MSAVLKSIFGKYAGREIKNPGRFTTDCDDVMDALAQEVRHAGFIFGAAHEKGMPPARGFFPPTLEVPEYEGGVDKKLRLTGNFRLGN